MLVDRAEVKPGDHVLVWGAAGGLGIFAVQLCKLMGAHPVAVVSSPSKIELVRRLGATMIVNRREFDFVRRPDDDADKAKFRMSELKRFGAEIRRLTGGKDPDIVFEHVGKDTFAGSVFLAKRFGKIVI